MRTIIPVHFDASRGDITIGATTYPGNLPGFHLVAMKRQPNTNHLAAPDVLVNANLNSVNAVRAALNGLKTSNPDAMIMMNTPGGFHGVPLIGIGPELLEFGATTELSAFEYAAPFSFIGSGGRAQGTAPLQRVGGTRPITGYLAPDSNGNYAFIQTDFVRYDIQLNGDITVGTKTYTAANSYRCNRTISGCALDCNGQNAFHLVIVDREDPTKTYADNTYCTGASDGEIQRLIGDLSVLTSNQTDESRLVLLGSSGKPIPAGSDFGTNGDARFVSLGRQIRQLGGYWETIAYLTPNDTFSLVGAAPPPVGTKNSQKRARESSSVYPEVLPGVRPSGELHGMLARSGRANYYSPLNADPSGHANLGLYEILAQNPVAFPHPVGDAEVAAFQYINEKLCGSGCNVRDLYDDLNVVMDNYKDKLRDLKDQNGQSCGSSNADANFCTVAGQLQQEFEYVDDVRAFYNNLQGLWLGSGSLTILSQLNAYNEVKAQLPAPPEAPSRSLAQKLVDMFLQLGAKIPTVGGAFGAADVVFNFCTNLTTDQQGNKTIDLTSTIGNLQQQAIDQFLAQQTTTGTLFELVFQDWGKLNALGTALATASKGSPWDWPVGATGQMLQQLTPAIRQAAYQAILSASYAIGSYVPNSSTDTGWGWGKFPLANQPYGYVAEDFRSSPYTPLSHPFNLPAYIPYTYPTDLSNQYVNDPRTSTLMSDNTWLGISALNTPQNGTNDGFQYSPPSEGIRTLLFNSIGNNGLGVYRPEFFNAWPFPRVTCDPSFGNRTGDHTWVGGCNWGAASPAPEQVTGGRSITDLTMRAVVTSQEKPRQPQVDVTVIIHNSGTLTAQSIAIDSITLRTLIGAGQATLVSPALPIRLTNLRPGDSTSVSLKLNVPPGVVRLSLTEQGSLTSGNPQGPETFRFNEAQSLFLQ
jgi:hypothetical protein